MADYIGTIQEALREESRSALKAAQAVWMAVNSGYSYDDIREELKSRGASPPSMAWFSKRYKVWDFWVVRRHWDPATLSDLTLAKLYLMAVAGTDDAEVLAAARTMSDHEFRLWLRGKGHETREAAFLRVDHNLIQDLDALANRLSSLAGTPVSRTHTLEVAVAALLSMPEEALRAIWEAMHGELASEVAPDKVPAVAAWA